jgi:hypothetical protein
MTNESLIPEINEEEIKDFPQQTTFNTDDMSVVDEEE